MKTNVGRGSVLCLAICETVLKKHKKKLFKNLTKMLMFPYRGMNLEMVLLWIRGGFECCGGIRTPYMEEI